MYVCVSSKMFYMYIREFIVTILHNSQKQINKILIKPLFINDN